MIRAATLATAEGLGMAENLGTVEVGKTADFAIVGENPLVNLKVLYGTGTQRYDPDADQMLDVGGVTYSVKDGVVYDAKALLAEVRRMVREQASPRADVSN